MTHLSRRLDRALLDVFEKSWCLRVSLHTLHALCLQEVSQLILVRIGSGRGTKNGVHLHGYLRHIKRMALFAVFVARVVIKNKINP